MAEHDHYMKFYPADYLADTGHLSTEEHGAYLLLIIAAFKRAGRLPMNQERLRRLAGGVAEERWPAVWASISEFFDIDGHELVQARAKAEWERARDAVEKAKIAGKASGDSRRRNKTPTGVEHELNGRSNGSSPGVGTSVELGAQLGTNDPDLDPGSSLPSSLRGSESDQTRSNDDTRIELRPGRINGTDLQRIFGRLREREVKNSIGWQVPVARDGKAENMADLINADPSAHADVVPTMTLLLRSAVEGKRSNSGLITKEPTYAFACWISAWTSLREEVRAASAPRRPRTVFPVLVATPRPSREQVAAHLAELERKKANVAVVG